MIGMPRTVNGMGTERRDADVPNPENWRVGDEVGFTVARDGETVSLFKKLPDGTCTRSDDSRAVN